MSTNINLLPQDMYGHLVEVMVEAMRSRDCGAHQQTKKVFEKPVKSWPLKLSNACYGLCRTIDSI